MVLKKPIEGEKEPKILWNQSMESVTIKQLAKETADVEKILWFGESNCGKTQSYLDVLKYLKKIGTPAEKVCMCIVFSDRTTGITKLYHHIPKDYVERVHLFMTNDYESMVKATANAEKKLMEHFKKTGVHGWLIIELLEESWRFSQDHYSREAFGETLADLMSAKRRAITELKGLKDEKKKESAFQALEGWRDWSVIKFYHNFNWIDRIKRMPFNVGATAETREIDNEDSMFYAIKLRPAGEKDNAHRFDTIIYKKHQGDTFKQRCFKLTGYSRLYSEVDITDKNSYAVHKDILKKFDKAGYHSSAIEELEKEAGIPTPPKKPEPTKETPKPEIKKEPVKEPVAEKQEEIDWDLTETKEPEKKDIVDKALDIVKEMTDAAAQVLKEPLKEIPPEKSKTISKDEPEKEITKEEIIQSPKEEKKPKESPKEETVEDVDWSL